MALKQKIKIGLYIATAIARGINLEIEVQDFEYWSEVIERAISLLVDLMPDEKEKKQKGASGQKEEIKQTNSEE